MQVIKRLLTSGIGGVDLQNSKLYRHKFLAHDMKGLNRVHIGHFVLVFKVDHQNKIVSFEDYGHHDLIYTD